MSKNLKPQRGLGRAVSSQRAKIKREVAKQQTLHRKMEMEQTVAELRSSSSSLPDRDEDKQARRHAVEAHKILMGVTQTQTAVMRSYGLTQRIRSLTGYSTSASTDYQDVVIRWNRPKNLDLRYNVVEIKGLFQHEMGHLLHSLSPRYLRSHPLWNDAVDRSGARSEHHLLRTINILEDQRMESRMVKDVPRLATYFTMIVGLHISRSTMATSFSLVEDDKDISWLLIAGRNYLPQTLREESMKAFDNVTGGKSGEWYEIVRRYKSARSVKALLNASVEAYAFIETHIPDDKSEPDTHDSHEESYWGSEDGQPTNPEDADKRVEDGSVESPDMDKGKSGEGTGRAGNDDSDSQDGSGASDQSGSKSGQQDSSAGSAPSTGSAPQQPVDETPAQPSSDGASGALNKAPKVRETALSEAQKAVEELINDDDISETVEAITESLDGGLVDLGLDELGNGAMLNHTVILSDSISMRMEETLNKWVSAKAPVWTHRVDQGRVNPLAYRSRTAGDRNFFDSYSGDGGQLLDVHLSLLCDNSGSMTNQMDDLSAVVKGTCDACDVLGIPRSVVLWSDETNTSPVWVDKPAEYTRLLVGGGTDPRWALDDLQHHNKTARKVHLVVVFTDGDWYANYTLRDWDTPDYERRFILVRYGDVRNVRTFGADVATTVHNVSDLATVICASLDDTLATVTL